MKYTLEADFSKFGFQSYFAFAKFTKKNIPTDKLLKILEDIPTVQYVALLKGEYDLLIYFINKDMKIFLFYFV